MDSMNQTPTAMEQTIAATNASLIAPYCFMVKPHIVKAVMRAAAVLDVRYYLNGVYFNVKTGRMVATDGHRMHVAQFETYGEDHEVIVPTELLAQALRQTRGKLANSWWTVRVSTVTKAVEIETNKGAVRGEWIDGKFPEWQRVMPAKPSGELAQYDPVYLADAKQAFIDFTRDNSRGIVTPQLVMNGPGPGIYYLPSAPELVAVIMPFRDTASAEDAAKIVSDLAGGAPQKQEAKSTRRRKAA